MSDNQADLRPLVLRVEPELPLPLLQEIGQLLGKFLAKEQDSEAKRKIADRPLLKPLG
jgi:hypothetical protein